MNGVGANAPARGRRPLGRLCATLLVLGTAAVGGAPAAARERAGDPTAGRLLVADGDHGLLRIFELPSRSPLATLKVGSSPVAVAVATDGRTAWVADRDDATLAVVDLESFRLARTMPMEGIDRPFSLATGDGGRWLLVGGETGRRFVQLATDRGVVTRAMTTTEEGPHRVAAARRGSRLFVANQGAGSVTEMAVDSLRIAGHWPIGAQPGALAAGADGNRLIVALPERREVIVLNGSGRELARRALPGEPVGVAILPQGTHALVAIGAPAGIVVIDLRSLQAGALRPLEGTPGLIVTDETGARAYVGGRESAIAILELPEGDLVGRIEIGPGTSALAWAPAPPPRHSKRKR